MKTKVVPHLQKTALMCPFKYASVALAAAVGLISAGQAQAQYVTGTPTLSNVPAGLTALYGSWPGNTSVSAAGFTASANGYGSSYYEIPVGDRQILNVNDTQAVLTFTLNDSGASQSTVWVGTSIYLNDNVGSYNVGGYVGMFGYTGLGSTAWSGATTNICAVTITLPAALITTIQAGGDSINGFNLQFDPAVYPGGSSYNVTFNSLVLQPVGGLPAGSPNITSYKYNSPTSFTLVWTSQASAQYTVQYSTDLSTGFTALVSNIASGGTTTTNTVAIPAGNAGFFRILQQ